MGLEEVQIKNMEHRANRAGWLRAAVLGSNDGLVSTSSLMIGIAAANKSDFLITAGLAGIAAGAMSMAVESMSQSNLKMILRMLIERLK